MIRIGVDLDGVMDDFNAAFVEHMVGVVGEDKFGPRPVVPLMWNYPTEQFGYSKEQMSQAWESVSADLSFWRELPKYPWTDDAMDRLKILWENGDADVYFITSRPGDTAKNQTEMWLDEFESVPPTVLISSEKGLCCKALKLDVYIDDKIENCEQVRDQSPETLCFMLAQSWNHKIPGVARIDKIEQFFAAIEDAIYAGKS